MTSFTKNLLTCSALLSCSVLTFAQENQTKTVQVSPAEQELINSRRANEDAQADYYRELTKKLHEPTPSPTPIVKSFSQSVAENPASALGVLGAFLTALFAASVGLLTLYVNKRAEIQNRMDTQFYEALKRFGDKDSPMIRSGAAGILTEMALKEVRSLNLWNLKLRHPKLTFWHKENPYHSTTLNQLISGLLLESNNVVLIQITVALRRIIRKKPLSAPHLLVEANNKLQNDMTHVLSAYFALLDIEKLSGISESDWEVAGSNTIFGINVIKYFTEKGRKKGFESLLAGHYHVNKTLPPDKKSEKLIHVREQLYDSSFRLSISVDLLASLLRYHPSTADALRRDNLFLRKANLEYLSLMGINLRGAVLVDAKLKGSKLILAKLEGANFYNADLTDVHLWGAKIDSDTNMEKANWWMAKFNLLETENLDSNLLDGLFKRYGSAVPKELEKVHQSIRAYLTPKEAVSEEPKKE